MDRIEYHWQAMAFDNCSVYFGIIIPSKIRDYIVEYIFCISLLNVKGFIVLVIILE